MSSARRTSLIAFLAAGFGSSALSGSDVVSSRAPRPCRTPPAETNDAWQEVRADGFTFCVPEDWRSQGKPPNPVLDPRTWRSGGASITWGTGVPPARRVVMTETVVARVGAAFPPEPTIKPEVREAIEIIGGRRADIREVHFPDLYHTEARWLEPAVYLQGEARHASTVELLRAIHRTVRFTGPAFAAQRVNLVSRIESACVSALPASVFTRVPVYLESAASDSLSQAILPGVDALTQLVALRLRTALGASETKLPAGDSILAWYQLGGRLALTVYRDGRFSWAPVRKPEDSFLQPSTTLLERVLTEARDAGERVFTLDVVFDSASFEMYFVHPEVTADKTVLPMSARAAIPVFSITVPWEKPAVPVEHPRIKYPLQALANSAEGSVLMQFVVDTTGRADLSTVRDLWPAQKPRLTGQLEQYYRDFVAAATDAVKSAKFSPAEIGGCRVPQVVQLPFDFKMVR